MKHSVKASHIKNFRQSFLAHPQNSVMLNAVCESSINQLALNREVVTQKSHVFTKQLDNWKATNQKQSGRCWCFAGLNLYRPAIIKKLGVEDFEFSQNFILFWDRIEKSNYTLTKIIESADLPLDDRLVANLLSDPVSEGGWWDNYINIVNKYGLVPKEVMPETESSSNSRLMNSNLSSLIKQRCKPLREMAQKDPKDKNIESFKTEVLAEIFNLVAIHLGLPPVTFDWKCKKKPNINKTGNPGKPGKIISEKGITPMGFFKKYVNDDMKDYITLVNDPRASRPFGKTYSTQWFNTVIEGRDLLFLNVPIKVLKEAVLKTLKTDTPLWMSADVSHMFDSQKGLMDKELFQYEAIYGSKLDLNKADRIDYHDGTGNHAMVFTGYDEVNGKVTKWRIENSWGQDKGDKGFFVMNDNWFDEHVYTAVIHKKFIPQKYHKALKQKPVMLMPWEMPY